ncbi:Cleavage and polyadenylation specificity factor subunit 6 [Nibea albiflora]|uniref:Cleavage and polyadenylation specificity factor subunit 6 n=1 Tax=Nibea albiflora TaxID=240163 RepID=A0ACB7EH82_NIBAL|nr:Cleavage and polyadenylation specificity factor subunit 6 [Nibea albiflora]
MAAAGPSTSTQDLTDIYSDLNQDEEDLDRIAEANELFDAVLTGSVDQDKKVATDAVPPKDTSSDEETQSAVKSPKGGNSLRRLSLYVGNFPWWTSDKDLVCMAQTLGVKDVADIKFAENRINGQSRGHTPQSTDADFEELMNRNRAVASTAITKAVSGAAAGDLRVAMETLLTAIAIIKQSRVYTDERCQALVTSLKDCLVSIQGNYSSRSSSRSEDEKRDRDRSRDRERERVRDRDRERDRDDSSGWDGAGMHRRRRESSWNRERDKERSREREKHREHREHRDRYR